MKITTQGNGIKIGKRLEEKIAGKLAKFDKYFGEEGSFNIKIHPERELKKLSGKVKKILVAEHNYGQIVLEVERIVKNDCNVDFIGKVNGTVITPDELVKKLEEAE